MQPYKTMLSKKAIEEFREIYKRKFRKKIDFNEAKEQAEKLLRFIKLIYYPLEVSEKNFPYENKKDCS